MEEWFGQNTAGTVGGIIGSVIGCYGGLLGCFCNYCINKGKSKLILGLFKIGIAAGVILSVIGIAALILKQPYHVWYVFVLPGGLTIVLFSVMFPVVRGRCVQQEMHKMSAKDL